MQPSKTGDVAGLESIKWLAFALMLIDHLARYAVEGLGPLPWLLGRLVFPLFAIALGVGVSRRRDLGDLVFRLAVWGVVAQGAMLFAAPATRSLNVLFTFAAGVVFAQGLICRRLPWLVGAVPALLISCASEYGPLGAAMVATAIWAARAHLDGARHWPSTLALVLAVGLLTPINGNPFALLALPVAWVLLRWPVELPRVRRLFYVGYAVQWAAVGALAWWLR